MSLETLLADAAPRLTKRVLAEMYANPFWNERFGDRGREHAGRDGGSHLQYLIEALTAGDSRVFTNYATWLRSVLVPRGMCSRHLVDNFERLVTAVRDEAWPEGERAVTVLRAGVAALAYTTGEAGAIDAERRSLARQVGGSLYGFNAAWFEGAREAARLRCLDDLDYHLSYLADALAFSERARFVEHLTFVAGFLRRRNVPVDHLSKSLGVLAVVLRSRFASMSEVPFEMLDAARAAIDRLPSAA